VPIFFPRYLFTNRFQVQVFHALARPGCVPQKVQAGFDARLIVKTPDGNALRQFCPAILFNQLSKDHFERNTMQGVVGLWIRDHGLFPVQQHSDIGKFILMPHYCSYTSHFIGNLLIQYAVFQPGAGTRFSFAFANFQGLFVV
jgi:hypothetical protein